MAASKLAMDEERLKTKEARLKNVQRMRLPDSDSDIEDVLCESLHLTTISSKVVLIPDFFKPGKGIESEFGNKQQDSDSSYEKKKAYDSTLPPKTQIVGATPEYIQCLKARPEKLEKLVPIFNVDGTRKPSFMYWNLPKAITDYGIIEPLMTSVIPNGGIKKLICREGKGEQLGRGSNVLINYYTYVEGISSCVESNSRRKKPHSFVLGDKGSGGIPVIELGTLTMKAKEIAMFLATPEYAYGKMGMGAWIPAKKRALCVIEVLSTLPSPSMSTTITNMVSAERKLLGFDEIYNFAMDKKLDGNKDLGLNKNARALRKYIQAATCLLDANSTCEEQETRKYQLLHQLYGNISIASVHSGQFTMAIEFCQKAIDLPLIPEENKAYDYLRCANALACEQKWEQAKSYVDAAATLLDDMPEVIQLQIYIHKEIEEITNKFGHDQSNQSEVVAGDREMHSVP